MVTYLSCCGVKELHSLGQYETYESRDFGTSVRYTGIRGADALRGFVRALMTNVGVSGAPIVRYPDWSRATDPNYKVIPAAFVLFTQAHSAGNPNGRQYGDRFKAWLEDEGLGVVTVIPPKVNPNSNNIVTPYMWAINHAALRAWWLANAAAMMAEDRAGLAAEAKEAAKGVATATDAYYVTQRPRAGVAAPF